jgi:hypothetical protein
MLVRYFRRPYGPRRKYGIFGIYGAAIGILSTHCLAFGVQYNVSPINWLPACLSLGVQYRSCPSVTARLPLVVTARLSSPLVVTARRHRSSYVVAERWILGCILRFMHAKNHFSDTLSVCHRSSSTARRRHRSSEILSQYEESLW